MTYSVLLVEDEPAALQYLNRIICNHCPEYRVSATARNGRKALELVERIHPDLIITDARMPVMDGIELVNRLRDLQDDTPALIISGYQEFEYVRGALNTSVMDYLLKPVSARRLRETLFMIGERLKHRHATRMLAQMWQAVRGVGTAATCLIASESRFHVAVFRDGGLRSRFDSAPGAEAGRQVDTLWLVPGRDEREWVILADSGELDRQTFCESVQKQCSLLVRHYATIALARKAADWDGLVKVARDLYRTVDLSIVPGKTRVCSDMVNETPHVDWDSTVADRISFALANADCNELMLVGKDLSHQWECDQRTLAYVEAAARSLVFYLQRVRSYQLLPVTVAEAVIESIVAHAENYEDIGAGLSDVLIRIATLDEAKDRENRFTPRFFQSIREYVRQHYADNLSLQSICQRFHLSRSYIGKLFRRYESCSFGKFLTNCRIEAAEELLCKSPRMPIKHIASYCGFDDPFYFSRVFKAVKGVPPSDFRTKAVTGSSAEGGE